MNLLLVIFFLSFIFNFLLISFVEQMNITKNISSQLTGYYGTTRDFCLNNRLYTFDYSFGYSPVLTYRETDGCTTDAIISNIIECSAVDLMGDVNQPCREGMLTLLRSFS